MAIYVTYPQMSRKSFCKLSLRRWRFPLLKMTMRIYHNTFSMELPRDTPILRPAGLSHMMSLKSA